jgi:hypothetical protein
MKRSWIVTVLFLATVASVASADEASHREAALELLEITNARQMLDQYMASFEQMMSQQLSSMDLPPDGQEAAKAVQKEMMDWLSEFLAWDQMKGMYVDIYIEVFTEEEVNELIEFYKSPLGQKLLAKMPELMQKTMQKTQAMLQQKMPEFQQRLQKSLSDLQEKYEQ